MAGSSRPLPEDDKKKIADADFLFKDDPKSKPTPKPGSSSKASSRTSGAPAEGYDLVAGHEEPSDDAPPPPPPNRAEPPRPKKPRAEAATTEAASAELPATVDEVWSRGAEWGGSIVLVAVAAVVVGILAYLALANVQFLLAFLILGLGSVVLIALAYPIFITLERPVRITPEQAVKDYYSMLSYARPHYKRMWLLLSSAGKTVREFSSFGEFCTYWKRKLASLQGGKSEFLNTLKFQVEDFRSEKSAGMSAIKAKFTVKVFRGTPEPANELAAFPISAGLVKGPDRMWYLNSGTLPEGTKGNPVAPVANPDGFE